MSVSDEPVLGAGAGVLAAGAWVAGGWELTGVCADVAGLDPLPELPQAVTASNSETISAVPAPARDRRDATVRERVELT